MRFTPGAQWHPRNEEVHRRENQPARRRMGGRRHLPSPRALQTHGRANAIRRDGPQLILSARVPPHPAPSAGWRSDGHRHADRHAKRFIPVGRSSRTRAKRCALCYGAAALMLQGRTTHHVGLHGQPSHVPTAMPVSAPPAAVRTKSCSPSSASTWASYQASETKDRGPLPSSQSRRPARGAWGGSQKRRASLTQPS